MSKFCLLLAIAVIIVGCKSTQRDDYSSYSSNQTVGAESPDIWLIELDYNKQIDLRGIYNSNDTIEQNSILYGGQAGIIGMLVQVAAHSAINSSLQNDKLAEQQHSANRLLLPLQDTLSAINQQVLEHESELYTFTNVDDETNETAKLISYPIFYLTQDATMLSIKHVVKLIKNGRRKPLYENLIEVISSPILGDEPLDSLKAENGLMLKEVLINLYQESLNLAVKDYSGRFDGRVRKQKTHKFTHGKLRRVERGLTLEAGCTNRVIRNLRGWLVAYHFEATEHCSS